MAVYRGGVLAGATLASVFRRVWVPGWTLLLMAHAGLLGAVADTTCQRLRLRLVMVTSPHTVLPGL